MYGKQKKNILSAQYKMRNVYSNLNELKRCFWDAKLISKASFSFALLCVSQSYLKYLKGIHAFDFTLTAGVLKGNDIFDTIFLIRTPIKERSTEWERTESTKVMCFPC